MRHLFPEKESELVVVEKTCTMAAKAGLVSQSQIAAHYHRDDFKGEYAGAGMGVSVWWSQFCLGFVPAWELGRCCALVII